MTKLADHLVEKKKVLLFDFDGTIFDTAKLKEVISAQLTQYTNNSDLLWETERKLRDERFHLIKTVKAFCEATGIFDTQGKIQDIFLHQNFPAFIFPDVIANLQFLHQDAILALFSEGDETYQQVKIYQSHLNALFDFLYIYHKKLVYLEEVMTFFDQKEIWYIDNQLAKLHAAHQRFPQLKTVWINREQLSPPIEFIPTATIISLDELPLILK